MPHLSSALGRWVLKLGARLKARGPREVGELAVQRAREWVSSSEELIVFSRVAAGPPPVTQGLSFRPATALDGARYARDIGTDSAATFRGRLSSATRCFVVESEGRLLHASWVTTAAAWTREIGGYLRVPRGHAYVYESYTLAEARGRGIYPFALLSIAAWLSAEQVHTVWVAVEASNQASRRAVEKAGFEPRFQIHYRRHLGRLRVTTSGDGGDRLELAAPEKKHWAALLHSKRSQEKPQRG